MVADLFRRANIVTRFSRRRKRATSGCRGISEGPSRPPIHLRRSFRQQPVSCGRLSLRFALVSMAWSTTGNFALMELELIEPALFLSARPEAAARFAEVITTVLTPRAT